MKHGQCENCVKRAAEVERLRKALSSIHAIAEDYPANDSQLDRIQIVTERALSLSTDSLMG